MRWMRGMTTKTLAEKATPKTKQKNSLYNCGELQQQKTTTSSTPVCQKQQSETTLGTDSQLKKSLQLSSFGGSAHKQRHFRPEN